MKSKDCCNQLLESLADDTLPISYNPKFREFSLMLMDYYELFNEMYIDADRDFRPVQLLEYCPFCGQKLPRSLREEWFIHIQKMGLEADSESIPKEFTNDTWWKTRGYDYE